MPEGAIALKSVRVDASEDELALWRLPRKDAEEIYAHAIARNDRDGLRWLACHDRYFLLTVVLQRADARDDWIYARCREVQADPDGYIDVWAREHYKSTIITFAGIIEEIIRDPEITIGIFSNDKPTAKDFLNQIKVELEDNNFLKWLFPDVFYVDPKKEARQWSLDDGLVVRRKSNPKEATIEVSGLVDGMATGKHYHLRVYDDVVTEKSVTTPEMIKKTTEAFELSDNLGTRNGRVWIIGTRYHFADTYGVLIQRGAFTERRHAATHNGDFDGKPVFLTQEQWDRKKAVQSKPVLASQQLLNPLAGAETRFDWRWLQFWVVRPKKINVYILVDPSKGPHKTSDNCAMAVVGIDVHRNKYLLDGCRHRMSLSVRWKTLKNFYNRWSKMLGVEAVFVGYEQFGIQTDLEYFEERMEVENNYIPIQEVAWPREGRLSKTQRIERLEPDFRMGRLRLPKVIKFNDEGVPYLYDPKQEKLAQMCLDQAEPWRVAQPIMKKNEDDRVYNTLLALIEEFNFFPVAPNDDFLDALSRIYDMDVTIPLTYSNAPGQANSVYPEHHNDF